MKIGIDLDNTFWGLVEPMLHQYNEIYDDNVAFNDLTSWNFSDKIKISCDMFFNYFNTEDIFCFDVKPYPYAIKVINQWYDKGHEIYFPTAGDSETIPWRNKLLSKYFPWYNDAMLIKCSHKQLLDLDVLFDDYPENLRGGRYLGILKTQPWNKAETEFTRFNKWEEFLND